MRTIKFRAWNKITNSMSYDPSIYWEGDYVELNQILSVDRFDFMQFTGLKDKNGVEIYEGDIVANMTTTDDFISEPLQIMKEVKYNDELGCFTPFCWYDTFNDIYGYEREWEVIGNIYQHPELIK